MKLTVIAGPDAGQSFTPSQETVVLGRGNKCEIVLHDRTLSRQHCAITNTPGEALLKDLDSANGTYVNTPDNRITTHTLQDKDEILIGKCRLRVELPHVKPRHEEQRQKESPYEERTVIQPSFLPSGEETQVVPVAAPSLQLRIEKGPGQGRGEHFPSGATQWTIGREYNGAGRADFRIQDDARKISRHHCTIQHRAGEFFPCR